MKSRHFSHSECLHSHSVALDISLVRRDLHRSAKDFAISFVKSTSFESRKWSRRGNSPRRADSDRAWADCGRTLPKKKISEIALASLLQLLSQPVGNVQFALYCDKHCIRRTVDRYHNIRHFLTVIHQMGQKAMETTPPDKERHSDLLSELDFTLAPRETDPAPVDTFERGKSRRTDLCHGHYRSRAVASEAICKWGAQCRRKAPAEILLMCPLTFLLCPHMRGHNDCLLPTQRQLKWWSRERGNKSNGA